VVLGTTGVLRGFALPDRQDQGRRTRRRKDVPPVCVRDLRRVGWPRLTCGRTLNLAVFAQVKAKREDLTG